MKKIIFAMIVAFLPMTTAMAVKMSSLYRVTILVGSQSPDLKEQAEKDGFLAILIKLTGDANIAQNPVIKPNLRRADYFVQDMSYSAPTTTSSEYQLQIRYDVSDVNRLLKKAGVTPWSENRPLVLVWMTVTNKQHETEIIGNESSDYYTIMKAQSRKFGIPLILPMMDMEDSNQVSVNDISAVALPVLKKAALRYSPDALLIGKIDEAEDGVHSEWHLVMNGNQWDWTMADKETELIAAAVMNNVSQALSKPVVKPFMAKDTSILEFNKLADQWVR